jgi:hypothetical protein
VSRLLLVLAFACGVAANGCESGRPRAPISDGERTYRAKCAACHRLYEPGERTPEQWESVVAKMQRLRKVHLGQADEDLILGYLAGARAPDGVDFLRASRCRVASDGCNAGRCAGASDRGRTGRRCAARSP